MSNYKYITDPVTGKRISNDPNSKDPNTVTDPFTGNSFSVAFDRGPRTIDSEDITQEDALSLPAFDVERSQDELRDIRAENQPAFDQLLNGIGKAGVTFATAYIDNMVGAYAGLYNAAQGGSFFNTPLGEWIDETNEWAQKAMPNYETRAEQQTINLASMNFWADKFLNGAAYSLASAAALMTPGLGGSSAIQAAGRQTAKTTAWALGKQAVLNTQGITSTNNIARATTALAQTGRLFKSALAESGIEARETFRETRTNLIQTLRAKKEKAALASGNAQYDSQGRIKVDFTPDEIRRIDEQATAASNYNYLTNLVLVGGTNALMFPKMLRGGFSPSFKSVFDRLTVTQAGKAIVDPKSRLKTAGRVLESAGEEALQEGGQFASNIAYKDFFSKGFDDEASESMLEAFGKGIKQTLSTKEGLESILIGALVGGGMSGARAGIDHLQKSTEKLNAKAQDIADLMNAGQLEAMVGRSRNKKRTIAYAADMEKAVRDKDEVAFHKAAYNMFKSDLYEHAQSGASEVFIDKLRSLKEMSDPEFKKFFGYEGMEMTLDKDAVMDTHIKNAEDAVKIWENIDFLYNTDTNNGITKLADALDTGRNYAKEIYKADLYDALTNYDFINKTEDRIGKELYELTNGLISYGSHENNQGGVIPSSTESTDLIDKKLAGIEEAKKTLKSSTLNPTVVKEAIAKLDQLKQLTKEREATNAIYNNLADITNSKQYENYKKFTQARKALIKKAKEKEALDKAKKAETAEEIEDAETKAALTSEKAVKEVKKVTSKKKATAKSKAKPIKPGERLSTQIKDRWAKHPELKKAEVSAINYAIAGPAGFNSIDLLTEENEEQFFQDLDKIQDQNNRDFKNIAAYYRRRMGNVPGQEKKLPKDQPAPAPLTDNESKEVDEAIPEQYKNDQIDDSNLGEGDTKVISRTLEMLTTTDEDGNVTAEYEDFLNAKKLNDPSFAPNGTKVYIRFNPNTKWNAGKSVAQLKKNGEIRLFVKEEDGTEVPIGQMPIDGSPIAKEAREAVNKHLDEKGPVALVELDLDIRVRTKWPGKIRLSKHWLEVEQGGGTDADGNYVELPTPLDITDNPIFGIGIGQEGNTDLAVPRFEDDDKVVIKYDKSKIKPGHTYLILPTPRFDEAGAQIYFPIRMVTKTVGQMGSKTNSILNKLTKLLASEEKIKGKDGNKLKNWSKVNEIIHLNYDLNNKGEIVIYPAQYVGKNESQKPVAVIPKGSSEMLEQVLSNMVMKVDINSINAVRGYNTKISKSGALVTNVDPNIPLYDMSFIIHKTISEEQEKQNIEQHAKQSDSAPTESSPSTEVTAPTESTEAKTSNPTKFGASFTSNVEFDVGEDEESRQADVEEKLESVKKNSSFIKLSEDGTHYINTKTGKKYQRVTDYITDEEVEETPLLKASQAIGNKVDQLVRDFFAGELKPFGQYNLTDAVAMSAFIAELKKVQDAMTARGETVLANDIVVYNDALGLAGTVDLLTYDKEGNIRIYDMKTMRGNNFEESYKNDPDNNKYDSTLYGKSKREKHTEQVSVYRILLNNTNGLKASTIGIMPIEIAYVEGDTRTTELKLLKGVELSPMNKVKDATIDEDPPTPKARKITEAYQKADTESELAYFRRVAPNIPINVLKDLSKIAKQGKNAWGLYLNGAVYLKENWSKGTLYHEAFHAVFNSFMTDLERQQMYVQAQIAYGGPNYEQRKQLRKDYPNLTNGQLDDIWLEEQLAEDFRRYVQLQERDKGLGERILDFFKRLWAAITHTTKQPSKIDMVFKNIHEGKYGQRAINHRFNNVALAHKVDNMTHEETEASLEIIDNLFEDILDERVEAQKKDNPGVDHFDVLQQYGSEMFYLAVYDKLVEAHDRVKDPTAKEFLQRLLYSFIQEDNGKPKFMELGKIHNREYRQHKFINLNTAEYLRQEEELAEDERETPENWQSAAIERNGKNTISRLLKRTLYNLKSTTEKLPYFSNQYKRVDFDSLYNYLERNMSGIYDKATLLSRLDDIAEFRPELKEFRSKIDSDSNLMAAFYHHFAKGQNQYLTILSKMSKAGGSFFQIINNNRRNLESEILTNWESQLKSTSLFKEGKIDTKMGTDLMNKYLRAVDKILENQAPTVDDFAEVADVLSKDYQIPIDKEALFTEFGLIKRTRFKTLMTGKSRLGGMVSAFAKGVDPFPSQSGYVTSIKAVARLVGNARLDFFQASIMNTEGKMQYSYVVPNALHKTVAFLNGSKKEIRELYGDDPSYIDVRIDEETGEEVEVIHSLLLDQILNSNQRIEVAVADGFKTEDEYIGTRFRDYSHLKFDTVQLNMYLNQGNRDAYYSFPMLSDNPVNYFLKSRKLTKQESLEQLFQIALAEKKRINTSSTIKSYSDNYNKFVIMPFLNDLLEEQLEDESENGPIFQAIKNHYRAKFKEYQDLLAKDDVIYEEDGVWYSTYLDKDAMKSNKYPTALDAIEEFFYANTVMTAEITNVFSGDLAFAASSVDANKRIKQLASPTQLLDPAKVGKSYKMGIVKDIKESITDTAYFMAIEDFVKKNPKYSSRLAEFRSKVNRTDGQTYITLDRWVKIMKASGQWSPKLEQALPAVKAGNESPTQSVLFMNAIKGFHFGLTKDSTGKVIPTQKKDSELPILPSMAKQNPELQRLLDRMEARGQYANAKDANGNPIKPLDGIAFESTIKVGLREVGTLDNLENLTPVEFQFKDFGIQQPSPVKHLESTINFGTQPRKLIISMLEGMYNIKDGVDYSAEDLANLYQNIIEKNLEESYNKIYKELGEGTDKEAIRKILLKEIEKSDLGYEYIEALGERGEDFKLPLWNPFHNHRVEALLNSIISKQVRQQKIKGATLINATDYGIEFDDDLKVVVNYTKDGQPYIEYMEAVLPAWSQDIMKAYMNPDGTLKRDKSGKIMLPEELQQIVGYRIPTEDKYSMMNVKVVRFSPQSQGGHIFLPKQITTISGLDFDIDKLYFMIPEHETSYDLERVRKDLQDQAKVNISLKRTEQYVYGTGGNLDPRLQSFVRNMLREGNYVDAVRYIDPQYDGTSGLVNNNTKARNNALIEIFKSVLSAPQTFQQQTNPGSFQNLKDERDYIKGLIDETIDTSEFILPQVQRQFFHNNKEAASLIGIFANHNTSHAINQYNPQPIHPYFRFEVGGVNVEILDSLDNYEQQNPDGISISRSLASLVAAAVDAVKEPVFYELNLNRITANPMATLLRAGVSERSALLFLNQPVIRELTKRLGGLSKVTPSLINRHINLLKEAQKSVETPGTITLTNTVLENNIKNNDPATNLQILDNMQKLMQVSTDLNTLVLGSKFDTTSSQPGPSLADNEVRIRNVLRIKRGLDSLPQSNLVFDGNYKMAESFYKYTHALPTTEIFMEMLPWYNEPFMKAKTLLESYSQTDLTANQINNINQSIISYLYTSEDFYELTDEDDVYLNDQFIKDLIKFQKNNKGKYLILDMLDVNSKEITFRNTTKMSPAKLSKLRTSWEKFDADQTEAGGRNLSEYLVKYNFMKHGFRYVGKSFGHLMPLSFHTDLVNEGELRKKVENATLSEDAYSHFVEQYVRNNVERMDLMSTLPDMKGVFNIKKYGKDIVSFELSPKYYRTSRGVEQEGLREKDTMFPKYIVHKDDNGVNNLFKRTGSPSQGNYIKIPRLGSQDRIEYFYQDAIAESRVKSNHFKMNKDYIVKGSDVRTAYDMGAVTKATSTDVMDETATDITKNNVSKELKEGATVEDRPAKEKGFAIGEFIKAKKKTTRQILPQQSLDKGAEPKEVEGYIITSTKSPDFEGFLYRDPWQSKRVYRVQDTKTNLVISAGSEEGMTTQAEALKTVAEYLESIPMNQGNERIGTQTGLIPNYQWRGPVEETATANVEELKRIWENDNGEPSKFTLHSGGAEGSDTVWETIGNEFAEITPRHYYVEGNKTPKGNTPISPEIAKEADEKLVEANEILKRKFPTSKEYTNNLLRRNWQQVKNSDAIFAIGNLSGPIKMGSSGENNAETSTGIYNFVVEGGTGWATQMAINEGKPVYLFNQKENKWLSGTKGDNGLNIWSEIETPVLTNNFAGIGTREITDKGKQAIRDVYQASTNLGVRKKLEAVGITSIEMIDALTEKEAAEFIIKYCK